MSKGRFGVHGGQYIPETLMNAVIELEEAYNLYKNDPEFNRELQELLNEYAGRPSRLYFAKRMTEDLGGAKIYLKPHRRAQNQQRARTGSSRETDGKNTCHRRDRSRSARRRNRYRCRPDGDGMRNFHGKRRYRAPGAQCIPDAASWRESPCRYFWNRHLKGCRFRNHARMDQPHR